MDGLLRPAERIADHLADRDQVFLEDEVMAVRVAVLRLFLEASRRAVDSS